MSISVDTFYPADYDRATVVGVFIDLWQRVIAENATLVSKGPNTYLRTMEQTGEIVSSVREPRCSVTPGFRWRRGCLQGHISKGATRLGDYGKPCLGKIVSMGPDVLVRTPGSDSSSRTPEGHTTVWRTSFCGAIVKGDAVTSDSAAGHMTVYPRSRSRRMAKG